MSKTKAFALALALGFAACDLNLPGSSTTVNQNIATNNNGGASPAPGGSPSPIPGVIDHVKVTQFGQTCGPGGREVAVGCTKFLTCTPFFANGTLVPPEIHGSSPTFFGVTLGAQFVQVSIPEEDFNRDVKGLFEGVAFFECEVKGVRSPPFDLTVVAAGSTSFGEELKLEDFGPVR